MKIAGLLQHINDPELNIYNKDNDKKTTTTNTKTTKTMTTKKTTRQRPKREF